MECSAANKLPQDVHIGVAETKVKECQQLLLWSADRLCRIPAHMSEKALINL